MKNTTFRKKALLSSVAMLLVALVALGSATFAWFSSNESVTATGVSVSTTKATNILIAKTNEDDAFGNTIDFEYEGSLIPVSNYAVTEGTWYTTNAAGYDLGTGVQNKVAVADSSDYFVETFYIKYDAVAAEGTSNVKIQGSFTIENDESKEADYLRVALYDVDNEELAFVWANTKAPDERQITAAVPGTSFDVSEQSNVTTTAQTFKFTDELAPGDVNEYKAFVWYEGCDAECIDSNAITANSVAFSFTGAAVA